MVTKPQTKAVQTVRRQVRYIGNYKEFSCKKKRQEIQIFVWLMKTTTHVLALLLNLIFIFLPIPILIFKMLLIS